MLLYKTILKPIWTYGIELWETASNSYIEILQRFQSKVLCPITKAPFYVTNKNLHKDLKIPFIKEETRKFSSSYLERLSNHTNVLAVTHLDETDEVRRLKFKHFRFSYYLITLKYCHNTKILYLLILPLYTIHM